MKLAKTMQQPIRETITNRAQAVAAQLQIRCLFVHLLISHTCLSECEKRKPAIAFRCSSVTLALCDAAAVTSPVRVAPSKTIQSSPDWGELWKCTSPSSVSKAIEIFCQYRRFTSTVLSAPFQRHSGQCTQSVSRSADAHRVMQWA